MTGIILTDSALSLPSTAMTLNPRLRGFPKTGLVNLYLFEDGSITAPISSGGLGTPAAVAGAGTASLLTGGGGMKLLGAKSVAAPAINYRNPWTIVTGGRVDIATSVVAPALASVGILSFSQYNAYASMLYASKITPWDTNTLLSIFQRNAANGITGTITQLSGAPTPDDGLLFVHSFDGTSLLSSAVYNAAGVVVDSGSHTINPITATTNAGAVVLTSLNPIVGNASGFSNGSFSAEAFAVYSRVLAPLDISSLVSACVALGSARGRAW